jgi:FkbM family methyltransferase
MKKMLNNFRIFLSRIFNFLYYRTKIIIFRRISNVLVKGLEVNVDDVIIILTSISDLYYQAKPFYEKEIFNIIINDLYSNEDKEIVFIDVGANIGRYSLFLAKKFPKLKVIAIEPDPDAYSALTKGVKVNGLANVIAMNIAISDVNGVTTLFKKYDASLSSIVDSTNTIKTTKVTTKRLDDVVKELGLGRVDWVKIDVEGAELHVLRGFRGGIARFRPKIIIEVKEFNREGVLNFFRELNYECKHIPEDELGEYFICIPKS